MCCSMDMELDLIEESYATFVQFRIDIPKEDSDMVDGLRYAFKNMLLTVSLNNIIIEVVLLLHHVRVSTLYSCGKTLNPIQ